MAGDACIASSLSSARLPRDRVTVSLAMRRRRDSRRWRPPRAFVSCLGDGGVLKHHRRTPRLLAPVVPGCDPITRRVKSLGAPEVVGDARVGDDNIGIPPEPGHLRPLHRRLPERRAELLLIQRQNVRRQRHRVLPVKKRSRPERRILSQRLRELHIPWADRLGDMSV